jgi:hypothetical protein
MTGLLGREALERRFRSAHSADAELGEVMASVARWVRTGERQLLPMGKELVAPPDVPVGDMGVTGRFNEYGLDADGRVVVARSRMPEGDELLTHEQITIERDGLRVWAVRFDLTIDQQAPSDLWTHPTADAKPLVVESLHRFAGYAVINLDEANPEDRTRASSHTLAELLTQDLRDALHDRQLRADRWWIVWVHYTGEATRWIDAAWPTISAATQSDRAAVTSAASRAGWRAGWDTLDWTLSGHEVALSPETQQALHGASGSVEALDEIMCAVAGALRGDGEPATIYIAAAEDLERLVDAVEALPPDQGRELRQLGLVPQV